MKKIILLCLIFIIIGCSTNKKEYIEPDNIDLYTAILKNHHLLYNNFKNPAIILNAVITDIENNNSNWNIPLITSESDFVKFIEYCQNEILHTQNLSIYSNFPGNDPWGEIYIENKRKMPSYKKLLPSEMIAMSQMTGKITGKCTSISHYISSILRLSGISENDIFLLRMKSHTIGLFEYNNQIYLINNNTIVRIQELNNDFYKNQFFGLYNDKYYSSNGFKISPTLVDYKGSLKSFFENNNQIQLDEIDKIENKEVLVKYAYQSIHVPNLEYYYSYSLNSPHTNDLARKTRDLDEIIKYLNEYIKNESIFPDDLDRIMLPDQVLVFKKGNYRDQALLTAVLLKINDHDSTIFFTNHNAYVKVDNLIIDFSTKEYIDSIEDNEHILLKIET